MLMLKRLLGSESDELRPWDRLPAEREFGIPAYERLMDEHYR
jgi:hypothetical protein